MKQFYPFYGFLTITPTRRVILGGFGTKLTFQEVLDKYPWGEPRWGTVETIDISDVPLDILKPFFKWLANAPIRFAYQWATTALKEIRRERLHVGKCWEDVLSKQEVEWALARLEVLSDGELCVDNFRVALKSNSPQVRRYKQQKKRGCCGSFDTAEYGPKGKYLLGFNYGH